MSIPETSILPVAVLLIPGSHDATIGYAKSIAYAIANHPSFTPPPPELPALTIDTEAYDNANVAAHDGGKSAVATRKAARKKVVNGLRHLCDRVQAVAEAQATPADAAAVIVACGLKIKRVVKRNKPALQVSYGPNAGSVILDARSVAVIAMYYWQYSVDLSTWTDVPQAMKTRVVVNGLTPGLLYHFRFHAHTRKGPVDASQIVSLLVH